MPILEDVKKALRITNNAFDDEVTDLIEASESDLRLAGIFFEDETPEEEYHPLIKRAIVVYAKAHFGYENIEAERFEKSYIMLKQHLSLAGDFNVPVV